MPELMKKADQGKKPARTMFADEDNLDLPLDLPKDIPTDNMALAKGHKRYQSPMAKMDTGDVPIHTPSATSDKSVSMGRMSQNLMASMGDQGEDEGYSEEETPVPPVEETLPSIIQTALSTTPGEVKSYQMANILKPNPNKGKLERMMHDQFSMFSENPMGVSAKDIYSISSWTNSKYEIQAMAAWVYMHGDRIADNITTNVDAMPGYLPKASLWEDHETETRFLIVRETPEDLAGENTGEDDVDAMLETDDPNIAENLRGQKPDGDQCLYYIYAWHEAKNHIEGNETKAMLTQEALKLAQKFPGRTVLEVYKELEWDYIREDIEKVKGGYENIGKTGKKHSKKPMTKKKARKQQKAMFANGYHEAVDPLRSLIPMLDKAAQLLVVPEFTDEQDAELSDLMDQIVPLIPRALRIALRNAGLGGRGAKAFIEEFSDPDVNEPQDWKKLLTDAKFLTKQFMDFRNDTSWQY